MGKNLVQAQELQVVHAVMIIIILVARAVTPILGIKVCPPTVTRVPFSALAQIHQYQNLLAEVSPCLDQGKVGIKKKGQQAEVWIITEKA
jgi:hypothetical protein